MFFLFYFKAYFNHYFECHTNIKNYLRQFLIKIWSKICIDFYLMQKRNLICFCFKPFSLFLFICVLYWRHTKNVISSNIMQLKWTGVSFYMSWIFLLSSTQMTKCCLYGRTNIHIVMLVYLCRMKDVYERTYAGTVGDLCFLFLISKSSGAEPVNATQSNMSSRPIGWATKRERKPTSIILSSNFKALR